MNSTLAKQKSCSYLAKSDEKCMFCGFCVAFFHSLLFQVFQQLLRVCKQFFQHYQISKYKRINSGIFRLIFGLNLVRLANFVLIFSIGKKDWNLHQHCRQIEKHCLEIRICYDKQFFKNQLTRWGTG